MSWASIWALGTSPPVVSGSHAAVSNDWVSAVEVPSFTRTGTTKQMTHGSTEIRPIRATCFTATHFLSVADIANGLLSEIGVTATGCQALQFSTAREKSRNQD